MAYKDVLNIQDNEYGCIGIIGSSNYFFFFFFLRKARTSAVIRFFFVHFAFDANGQESPLYIFFFHWRLQSGIPGFYLERFFEGIKTGIFNPENCYFRPEIDIFPLKDPKFS